ncbi:MAG: ABC transporter permease [Thermoproteales archaeon]|nr:ABC transporter permease [Thermoproteales archaeon]RLE66740.1 MAG: hypothetical protein DRJ47_01870 [Thermoprotei archaeon]
MKGKTRLTIYLRTIKKHFIQGMRVKKLRLKWALPFQFTNILLGVLSYIYYAQTFGAKSPFLKPYGGNFLAYILIGMVVNSLLVSTMRAPSSKVMRLFMSGMSSGRQTISLMDHIMLSGDPMSAVIIGQILDSWVDEVVTIVIYLVAGYLLGFKLEYNANYLLAIIAVILGVLASLGIGFISASLVFIIGPWRGIDPMLWIVSTLGGVFSGVYFPIEVIPENIRFISYLLPQTYVLEVCRDALLRRVGFFEPIYPLTVLLIYTIILLSAGVFFLRKALVFLRKNPIPGL